MMAYQERKKRHHKKIKARRLVQQMVIRGVLSKDTCYICGKAETEAHHIFYDYPKNVLWLCSQHHRLFHKTWKEVSVTK